MTLDSRRYLFALAIVCLLVTIALSVPLKAYAETCNGCHTNPKFQKADKNVLTECLACHGRAGHPLKDSAVSTALSRTSGEAEAAEPVAGVKAYTPESVEPDLKDMVRIPEGEFLMGTDDRLRDEKPAHVVYIDAFYIDIYEVTNADYKRFVDKTGHAPPNDWEAETYPEGHERHPVIFVDWYDSKAYCEWRGKRLPREREWEKAARGTDGRVYPWGDEWDLNKSNNPLAGREGTVPVGSFESGKNQFGLYDMSGNVWEWVDEEYFPHPGSDYVNPEFGSHYKLLKGGSWWDCMFYGCGISAPMYNRSLFEPVTKSDSYGFRCAADDVAVSETKDQ